jgi:hypothetical protein
VCHWGGMLQKLSCLILFFNLFILVFFFFAVMRALVGGDKTRSVEASGV